VSTFDSLGRVGAAALAAAVCAGLSKSVASPDSDVMIKAGVNMPSIGPNGERTCLDTKDCSSGDYCFYTNVTGPPEGICKTPSKPGK
jgi:hypothetical protein